jgi:hypothetical protein
MEATASVSSVLLFPNYFHTGISERRSTRMDYLCIIAVASAPAAPAEPLPLRARTSPRAPRQAGG